MPLGADLSDEPGPDASIADADGQLAHESLGQLVRHLLMHIRRIAAFAIPSRAHHDMDVRGFADPAKRPWVTTDALVRRLHDGPTAGRPVQTDLGDRDVDIIDDPPVVTVRLSPQREGIDDDMVVAEGDPEVLRRYRATDSHDLGSGVDA